MTRFQDKSFSVYPGDSSQKYRDNWDRIFKGGAPEPEVTPEACDYCFGNVATHDDNCSRPGSGEASPTYCIHHGTHHCTMRHDGSLHPDDPGAAEAARTAYEFASPEPRTPWNALAPDQRRRWEQHYGAAPNACAADRGGAKCAFLAGHAEEYHRSHDGIIWPALSSDRPCAELALHPSLDRWQSCPGCGWRASDSSGYAPKSEAEAERQALAVRAAVEACAKYCEECRHVGGVGYAQALRALPFTSQD